jgi:hypothetical protein
MSVWDDPELRAGGDFITFENVGDTASGVVQVIRVKRWDDGKVSPEILLVDDNGEEKTLTAGQIKLKLLLAEQRPEVGDHITVKLTDIEKRSGGKTLKHFSLDIKRGTGTAAAAPEPAPASAAAPAVDQAAVAAALAALTPEQKKAMGIPA